MELPAATKQTDAIFCARHEKKWFKVGPDDSIGSCCSELCSLNFLQLPLPPCAAILVSRLLLFKLTTRIFHGRMQRFTPNLTFKISPRAARSTLSFWINTLQYWVYWAKTELTCGSTKLWNFWIVNSDFPELWLYSNLILFQWFYWTRNLLYWTMTLLISLILLNSEFALLNYDFTKISFVYRNFFLKYIFLFKKTKLFKSFINYETLNLIKNEYVSKNAIF